MQILTTDHIVIGSGIAGLSAARELSKHGETLLISKGQFRESATQYAQGGIAAALQKDDAPSLHFQDTLNAGDGLCDEAAVKILVEEGPKRVKELIQLGAKFDQTQGELDFTQEAAHSHRRILHAGDATGKEIEKTLGQTILNDKKVKLISNTSILNLIVQNNTCLGCTDGETTYLAKATILATGGCGQLYARNTNPPLATGDGIAMAYRAGAIVQDMEFMQFHPTTLYLGDKKPISIFLITEAVRGEGALLRNIHGERFMPTYHPKAELAPRDHVARAIFNEMQKTNAPHVYLDLSQLTLNIAKRFPTIYQRCLESKIDITRDFIPVAPAAHYFMGGIKTDLWGKTSIKNLYAGGEVACLGIHGANRLASNSLLDGLVFGHRIAHHISHTDIPRPTFIEPIKQPSKQTAHSLTIKHQLRDLMWNHAGIIRNQEGLIYLIQKLESLDIQDEVNEVQNMLIVSKLIAQAALDRTESRGSHFRSDYPERNDTDWQRRLTYQLHTLATHPKS
jgi:L-aspartate oxidase